MHKYFILSLAYFVSGWLGLLLPFSNSHITLVWLPTGIAVAALYRWGARVWPAVFVGAVLVNALIGSPWYLALWIGIGNTIAPCLCAYLLQRFDFHPEFDRQQDAGLIIGVAMVAMLVSATSGVVGLYVAGALSSGQMGVAWLSWWLGDGVGVLLAAPLLLSLSRQTLALLMRDQRAGLVWLAVAAPVAWLAFFQDYTLIGHPLPLAFFTLPLIAWATLRFGILGGSLAGLLFCLLAAWGTSLGRGTFYLPDIQISLLLLWAYMACTILTCLMISALQAKRAQASAIVRDSEAKLRGLFELSPMGIVLTDLQGQFITFNDAFLDLFGYERAELMNLNNRVLTPRKFLREDLAQFAVLKQTGRYGPYEKEYIQHDGRRVPVRLNGILIHNQDGQEYIWSMIEDISESRQIELKLKLAAAAFDSQDSMMILDRHGVIQRVNQAFVNTTGFSADEAIGQTPRILQSGRHDAEFYREMWAHSISHGGWRGEIWNRNKAGEITPQYLTITAVKDEHTQLTHFISTYVDISERKEAEEKIKTLAFYDHLTHLPNRALLQDRLKQAMAGSSRSGKYCALLFIDLDHFKRLNDTLGHAMGDLLLQQVATHLLEQVRAEDTVARLGGDEFVVLLTGLSTSKFDAASQTEGLAEKLRAVLNRDYVLNHCNHRSAASIGVTLFQGGSVGIDDLLRQADLAMYKAKESGRNALSFFDPEMETVVLQRTALEADFRAALEKNQFVLHYQPQIVGSTHLIGVEALVRWAHPVRQLIPPTEFIPLAEETGLIKTLGLWVLVSACQQIKRWSSDPQFCKLTVAVNVSAQQLRARNFVEQVKHALLATQADPTRLKLELTESLLVDNVQDTIEKMHSLKAMGVSFSLDDFGTGYSSLSYLKRLPLDQLKIDKSFVCDVLSDPNDAAIARTIIALAESLALNVIAEGVETEMQRDFLAHAGCHAYQGYYFSRPLPLAELEHYARQQVAK